MTCCCHCQATEKQFDERLARRDLKRYRSKGPDKTTRLMLDAVRAEGLPPATLLDVGGGIGVLHHELLGELVSRATHVEASSALLAVAKEETERRGHGEAVSFAHGDFVEMAAGLPEADVVALDRVICCYPELDSLVSLSAAKASRLYLASFPRWRWWVRLGNGVENAIRWVKRDAFRTFVRRQADIESLLDAAGLECCYRKSTFIWEVVGYQPGAAGDEPGGNPG